MKHHKQFFLFTLGLAAVATACAPADGQTPVQAAEPGTYQLATINGSPLPAVVEEEEGCREEVTGATLTLSADGRWTLRISEREVCGQTIEEEEDEEQGRYAVDGQTVRFDLDEEDDEPDDEDDTEIDIDDLSVGALGANALTIRLEDGRTTVVFRR